MTKFLVSVNENYGMNNVNAKWIEKNAFWVLILNGDWYKSWWTLALLYDGENLTSKRKPLQRLDTAVHFPVSWVADVDSKNYKSNFADKDMKSWSQKYKHCNL